VSIAGANKLALPPPNADTADKSAFFQGDSRKRADIVAAASDVFLEYGFAAASVDEIARRARVSKATVYSHFEGKHALFGAIFQGLCQEIRGDGPAPDLRDLSLDQALFRVGRQLLDVVFTDRAVALYRVVIAEVGRTPELCRTFYEAGPDRPASVLAAYFQGQIDAGALALNDARQAAEQYLGMVLGQHLLRHALGIAVVPGPAARNEMVATAVRVFLNGALREHRPSGP
jgi:TetR/AcrR family transcriptional regulator, mexJK operon transcriptional repressor